MSILKKALALALVFAFAFSLMAGAIFTDNASIEAKDQVNLIAALGVVNGYPDGTFGADRTITRAEAAKMIYVIKNGSDTGSSNYKNAANPFSDVSATHWAKGYINYCYLNGIIAGIGNGKFSPEGKVTGAQLAKMLLTVIGYDAKKAGLVGNQWLISTMSLAFENDLFEDYSSEVSAAAPRGDAAVLFYNAIFTPTVKFADGQYVNYSDNGNDLPTVGAKYFDLKEYEGTLTAADGFALTGSIADDTIKLSTGDTFDFEGGRELVGQDVKVIYDDNKDKVYNVIPTGDSAVYNVNIGDIDADGSKIKFNDKSYSYSATVFENYKTSALDITAVDSGAPVRLVDTQDDGTIDYAFVNTRTFAQVTGIDSKAISLGGLTVKFLNSDDERQVFGTDGIKEDDFVFYYKDEVSGSYYVEKAKSVTGTVTGQKATDTTIEVNGKFYELSDVATGDIGDASQDAPKIGDSYTVYLDGAYWAAAVSEEAAVAGSGNYCVVKYAYNKVPASSGSTGTDASVLVYIPGEDDPVEYKLNDDSQYLSGGKLTDVTLTDISSELTGKMFAYSIKSDGKILLTQDMPNYKTGVDISYNSNSDVFTAGGKSYLLADDAVIFYSADGGATFTILGKGDFSDSFTTDDLQCVMAYTASNGFNYIKGAIVVGDNATECPKQDGASSDDVYGYLLSDPVKGYDKAADQNYIRFDMWSNGKNVTVRQDDGNVGTFKKGDFVVYTLGTDGLIDSIADAAGLNGDIQAYSSALKKVTISGTIYSITEDTVTIYIDNDGHTGETGSGYPKISSADAATASNCYYVTDPDNSKELLFIAVDVSSTLPN